MKLATTTGDFKRWCKTNIERLDCISESGFRYVDLNMYADTENPELFFADNWKENVIKIKKHAENSGLSFVQAHAPGINPFLPHVDYNNFVDITKRAIEISGMLGIKNLVVHGGIVMDPAAGKDIFTEKNINFLSELFPLVEEYNVNLLYENSPTILIRIPNLFKQFLEIHKANGNNVNQVIILALNCYRVSTEDFLLCAWQNDLHFDLAACSDGKRHGLPCHLPGNINITEGGRDTTACFL